MLYDKIVDRFGKVRISGTAYDQYKLVNREIGKLCELTSQDWGLIHDPWFKKVCKVSFAGGCVCGLTICGVIFCGHKIMYAKRNSKND